MNETLSALDASFLFLERAWAPMHFGGLSILDPSEREAGPLEEDELRAAVGRRFRALPRLHMRAVDRWHGLRHTAWEPAEVDLDHHVRAHRLPEPGGQAELLRLTEILHGAALDHSRPLWELHLIEGLAGGRQATLMKVHHSVADGIGGMDVAEALFDRRPGRRRRPARPASEPVAASPLAPLRVLEGAGRFLLGGLGTPTPLFDRPVGPRRSFAFATLAADDLRVAKHRLGGTVDDLLLEVVTAGLARYLSSTSNYLPGQVRVMVPISTRGLLGGAAGNHVTVMFLDLPLGLQPDEMVGAVAGQKRVLRELHEGPALAALVELSGLLPAPLQRAAARLVTAMPTYNLVVSDIPGPAEPYRLLGARVEAMYPLMPLAPHGGLSIAAINTGGVVGFGVTADPAQCAEPGRLAAEIEAAARDLARPPVRPRSRRPRAAARTSRRSAPRCAPRSRGGVASASASAPRPPR